MKQKSPTVSVFRSSQDGESFAAGVAVFRENDPGDCMFVVQDGEVDIAVRGTVVETVGPGGLVGEMALIDAGPRSASAVARVDSKLVRVDERRFRFLVQEHPFFALEVMRVMAHRLRRMDERLSDRG
jgi:CRP/FNR family transcriptional regulator, cyclic AMP receptor protein